MMKRAKNMEEKVLNVRDFFDMKTGTKHKKTEPIIMPKETIKEQKYSIKSFFKNKEKENNIKLLDDFLFNNKSLITKEDIEEPLIEEVNHIEEPLIEEVNHIEEVNVDNRTFEQKLKSIVNYLPSEEELLKDEKKVDESIFNSVISHSASVVKQTYEKKRKKDELDDIDVSDKDALLNLLRTMKNDLALAKRSSNKISGGMGGGGGSIDERHIIHNNNTKISNRKKLNFVGFNITENQETDTINIENTNTGDIIIPTDTTVHKEEIEEIDVVLLSDFKLIKYYVYLECIDKQRHFELTVLNKNDILLHSIINIMGDLINYNIDISIADDKMFFIIENKEENPLQVYYKKEII